MQDALAGEVTRLLKAWCRGDTRALERLAPMIEQELRRLASWYASSVRKSRLPRIINA
jgi:hypothetical protein